MICEKCGAEMRDGSKFCTKCGTAATVAKRTRNKSVLIIVVTIVLLIIVIAAIAIIVNTSSSKDDEVSTKESKSKNSVSQEIEDSKFSDLQDLHYGLPESLPDDFFEIRKVENLDGPAEILAKVYSYDNDLYDMSYVELMIFVRNTSKEAMYYNGQLVLYDENKNKLDHSPFYFSVIGPGETTMQTVNLKKSENVSEVRIEDEECSSTICNLSLCNSIEIDTALSNYGIVANIKNNSSQNAHGSSYIVYFDENGIPCKSENMYAEYSVIPAGYTITNLIPNENGYASAIIFKNMHASENDPTIYLDETKAISHREYRYVDEYGNEGCYSVVKNISDEYIDIYGYGFACDSNNDIVDCEHSIIYNLSPGDETVMTYYFKKYIDYDAVNFDYIINTTTPDENWNGTDNLSIDMTKGDKLINLCCTNNDSVKTKFTYIISLFFDKEGTLIYVGYAPLSIEPGGIKTVEITAPEEYDSVEYYLYCY